jgi:hypothetical protein
VVVHLHQQRAHEVPGYPPGADHRPSPTSDWLAGLEENSSPRHGAVRSRAGARQAGASRTTARPQLATWGQTRLSVFPPPTLGIWKSTGATPGCSGYLGHKRTCEASSS